MPRQQGFAMLELLLAVMVATLLAVWGATSLVNKINDSSAQASAAWMLSARTAVQAYIDRYAYELLRAEHATALAASGYADWAAPRLAELKADNLLSRGFPELGPGAAGLSIRLLRQGECLGNDCRLEAILYRTAPFVHPGSQDVDEQMVAQWMMAAQGWGGMVSALRPQFISGPAFQLANPPSPGAPLPAGTVALAITAGQLSNSDFLRVRDARDPDFQGSLGVAQDLRTQRSAHVKEYLYLGTQEDEYERCEQDGAIAREFMGGLLVCRGKEWRSVSRGGGGGFSTNSRHNCRASDGSSTANPVTGSCNCPSGHAAVLIADSGIHSIDEGRTLGFLCVG